MPEKLLALQVLSEKELQEQQGKPRAALRGEGLEEAFWCTLPQDAREVLRGDTLGHHSFWANTTHTQSQNYLSLIVWPMHELKIQIPGGTACTLHLAP